MLRVDLVVQTFLLLQSRSLKWKMFLIEIIDRNHTIVRWSPLFDYLARESSIQTPCTCRLYYCFNSVGCHFTFCAFSFQSPIPISKDVIKDYLQRIRPLNERIVFMLKGSRLFRRHTIINNPAFSLL